MGNPISVDMTIRKGTKGQIIEGVTSIDCSTAVDMWFEFQPYDETDPDTYSVLTAELSPESNYAIRYITDGTEFPLGLNNAPAYYKIIAIVKFSDDRIYYSDNKRILLVKGRFD